MNFTVSERIYAASTSSITGSAVGSFITSQTVDMRDAFDLSLSIFTSGGTTSTITVQQSDWTGSTIIDGAVREATWSNWTNNAPSSATNIHPPLGPRYLRCLVGSRGTFEIIYNKHVR